MGLEIFLKDKRGRSWEMFCDEAYFHQWCVRCREDRSFNSPTSFHFATQEEAQQFISLIEKSS